MPYKDKEKQNKANRKWQREHPEKIKKNNRKRAEKIRKKRASKCCLICGFNRTIDMCHIFPERKNRQQKRNDYAVARDKDCIWLCPNHHRLFDSGKLTKQEHEKIREYIDREN